MHDQFQTDEIQGKIYDWRLIRRLSHYLAPHLLPLAAALTFLLLGAGLELMGPYLVKVAIDTYIKAADYAGLNRICIIFLTDPADQIRFEFSGNLLYATDRTKGYP